MGKVRLKELTKQIDLCAERSLPLTAETQELLRAWAVLHGWDAATREGQRLLVRQALLDSALRELLPGARDRLFDTPLQALGITTPQGLVNAVQQFADRSRGGTFNFWGDLYAELTPQADRRRIGQFWTDPLIAEWMVTWLLQSHPRRLVDVGCGAGNFLLTAAAYLRRTDQETQLHGLDVSPLLLNVTVAAFASAFGTKDLQLPTLSVQDYLHTHLPQDTDAVVCNPPYTRHHHIAPSLKDELQALFKLRLHLDVSRQATMAFHFLLKLIADMPEGASAAVIVPMEVLDARYGSAAKRALCRYTRLHVIVHFSPEMNAFRKVDVGAAILFFQKGSEKHNVVRNLTLHSLPSTQDLLDSLESARPGEENPPFGALALREQESLLGAPKWLSVATRPVSTPEWDTSGLVVPLRTLAKVVRGIATGANDFFALPTEQVKRLGLEPYVVRTVHRNREVQDLVLGEAGWQSLSDDGKCVWLLYLNGDTPNGDPKLREYLQAGETKGYHLRSLVQTRREWFIMEQREVPAIFFTILTRGNPRFILNRAGVRPLNMFSLIYPNAHVTRADATEVLWALLNTKFSLSRLHSVSRTYGGNTLKVEPRELGNLPVVNPLALPPHAMGDVRHWIADFHTDRDAALLGRRVDRLVEALLADTQDERGTSPLPVQLALHLARGGERE